MTAATANAEVQSLVEKLYAAFNDSGFMGMGGTDEDGVLAALKSARDQGLMKEVDALYRQSYPGEPGIKEELDDELSGDEFRTAMAYYEEGMKPAAKQAAATGAETPGKGHVVHGTMGPRTPAQKWRDDVLAVLSDLQRKMEEGSGPLFGDAGDPYGRWDKESWKHDMADGVKSNVAFAPRLTPYKAVAALSDNLHLWTLDCATFAEAALLLIWKKFLGREAAFDKRFAGLILRDQHSEKLPILPPVTRPDNPSALAGFDAGWDASPPGTKISWKNLSNAVYGTPWEHEFGIKRRSDGTAAGAAYDAFPLGCDLAEDVIKKSLAEQAYDYPMQYMLTLEGVEKIEADEGELRPLHTAMAQSVRVEPKDRLPSEVIGKLKSQVAGNAYANRRAFEKALFQAGVSGGFVASFKDQAMTTVDSGPAEAYIRKNIIRYDYSSPKIG